jgi:hypothetical protein
VASKPAGGLLRRECAGGLRTGKMEAEMKERPSWTERLLTLAIVAAAVIVTVKAVTIVAGLVAGVVAFVLFTVLPLAVAGWIGLMLYRILRGDGGEKGPA